MPMLHRPIDVTRDYIREELAKPNGRVRFLHGTGPDSNGGFIVDDPVEGYHEAVVLQGWAEGVREPICAIGADFLFESYLSTAAVWIERGGQWVRVKVAGCSGGPDEDIRTD